MTTRTEMLKAFLSKGALRISISACCTSCSRKYAYATVTAEAKLDGRCVESSYARSTINSRRAPQNIFGGQFEYALERDAAADLERAKQGALRASSNSFKLFEGLMLKLQQGD